MGRTRNPDYFKVGGSAAGSGVSDAHELSPARLAAQQARLQRASPHADRPPVRMAKKKERRPVPPAKVTAPRAERPVERRQKAPVAVVEPIHLDKPRHGKKRRSAQKRHEVAVLHEQPTQPESAAAQRPPAPVADLRDRRRRRPEEAGPTTLPPSLQDLAQRTWVATKETLLLAWELAVAPFTVVRVLTRLRARERRQGPRPAR